MNYADWQDSASEAEQNQRDDALEEIRRRIATQGEASHTHCQWCGDETTGGNEFCGKECRDDAERVERALERNEGFRR